MGELSIRRLLKREKKKKKKAQKKKKKRRFNISGINMWDNSAITPKMRS